MQPPWMLHVRHSSVQSSSRVQLLHAWHACAARCGRRPSLSPARAAAGRARLHVVVQPVDEAGHDEQRGAAQAARGARGLGRDAALPREQVCADRQLQRLGQQRHAGRVVRVATAGRLARCGQQALRGGAAGVQRAGSNTLTAHTATARAGSLEEACQLFRLQVALLRVVRGHWSYNVVAQLCYDSLCKTTSAVCGSMQEAAGSTAE